MNTITFGQIKCGSLITKGGRYSTSGSGAPTNGATGTLNSRAAPGATYTDTASGVTWTNIGTKAAPVWSPLTPVTFSVSSATILVMFTTPLNLIAAPPTGYCILVDNIMVEMIRTATAYTSGGVVSFPYTGGSVNTHSGTLPASVVTGGAGTVLTQLGPATGANGTTVPTATGVDITNATGVFATGTGTMKVFIDYRVIAQ